MAELHALSQQVLKALEDDFTVITANQRAVRALGHAFDLKQRACGRSYWPPPAIISWDAWLQSLWHRLIVTGNATQLLLNSTQEQSLWRAIIKADTATASLRPIDALAQTAGEAWRRLHDYRSRQRLPSFPGNTDTRAFARWAAELERRCGRGNYLTQAQLPDVLRAAIAAGDLTVCSSLLLVGFDSRTPAQIALLDAIRANGVRIDDAGNPAPAAGLTLAAAPDEPSELEACARWTRAQLDRQPQSRIAIVVPAIGSSRAGIDRVFRQTLAPELNDITAPAEIGPYEFSLGIPLAHTPMVACALDILRWTIAPLPLERIAALLLSPYFAADPTRSELLARAEFDAAVLRRHPLLRPELPFADFLQIVAGSPFAASLPTLLAHLRAPRPQLQRRSSAAMKRPFAEWAATMHELLEASGWAQPGHLDSIEFQTRRKWESALDELATLDYEGAQVSFADALEALERIASETLFAPESRHAPVQIMGPLESAGSSFDAIWFLRANDLAWPSAAAANPLLPWLLQRESAMPGADPAHDTAHARRITERIAGSASAVVFSYAKQSSEGAQRRSSVLSGFTLEEQPASSLAAADAPRAPIVLDKIDDDTPIPPPPDAVMQGGASVLQAQAACGFRAFAEKRLFSSALDSAALGLEAAERGSIVHAVLENFWAQVRTQAALKALTRDQRIAQLESSIGLAFSRDYAKPGLGWPEAYLAAERQRLVNLLLPWLEFEATRRSPFTVESREERLRDISIGPLRLDIRVDRIDRVELPLAEGEDAGTAFEMILDYKTSDVRPPAWLDSRPDEPQLPLYAVVSGRPHLAGVAFAIIRPGNESALRGYQSRDGILPKPAKLNTASFEAQIEEWRGVLTALAEDFHRGDALVAPKKYPQTCTYCEQRLLCRIDPASLEPDAFDEPDSESDMSAEADRG